MTISSKQIKEEQVYTKAEVDALIEYAVEQARQIDEESMKKHNREATGTALVALFAASPSLHTAVVAWRCHPTWLQARR